MCCVLADKFPIHCGWNVVVLGGLIRLAMVFRHLNAILKFVFLNMFVTLHICGEMYVKVVHLLHFVLCFIWCLSFCIIVGGKPLSWAM